MKVRSHEDLIVWQRSIDLVIEVYRLASQLPPSEVYGLAAQLKRAASSVPSNIAEGFGRATGRDFANFLSVAKGSLMEVQTLVVVCDRLGFFADDESREARETIVAIDKMLTVLRKAVRGGARGGSAPLGT